MVKPGVLAVGMFVYHVTKGKGTILEFVRNQWGVSAIKIQFTDGTIEDCRLQELHKTENGKRVTIDFRTGKK